MTKATQPQKQPKEPLPPITDAIRKQASDCLKKAKVQLAINHPFFAQIVFGRKIEFNDKVSTAYITKRGRITLGTRFAAGLKVQQMVFLLAHEAMHYAMLHMLRRKHRDPKTWNVAGDAVINDLLQTAKVGEFIDGGVDIKGSKDKTSEKVYDELPPPQKRGKGKGDGGPGSYEPGEGWDDLDEEHDGEQMDESQVRELEESIRQEVAQAAAVARQQGSMPAGMDKLIDEIVNPKTPWHQILERYMTSYVKADYSFRRPNRRHLAHGLYLPSADKVPQMGTVVIESDESGSIGDQERAHFGGHINAILERCRPEKVILLHVDTHVHKVEEFTLEDLPIKFQTYACGGTDMTAGITWCEKNGIEPEVFICLTDGHTPWPAKPPAFDTVWLVTTDQKSPVGLTIPYRMDEEK